MKQRCNHTFVFVRNESFKRAGRYQWIFLSVDYFECTCGKTMKVVKKHSCFDRDLDKAPKWVQEIRNVVLVPADRLS